MGKQVTYTMKIDKDIRDTVKQFCNERGLIMQKFLENAALDEIKILKLKDRAFNFETAFGNYEENIKHAKGFTEVTGIKGPQLEVNLPKIKVAALKADPPIRTKSRITVVRSDKLKIKDSEKKLGHLAAAMSMKKVKQDKRMVVK